MKTLIAFFSVSLLINVSCANESAPLAKDSAVTEVSAETAAAPSVPAVPAEAVISKLYEDHAKDRSPFFQATDRNLVDTYFEKSLADLIWNDVVASKGEVGAIGSDPLYDSQDIEIKNLLVQPAVVEAGKARVVVTFENFGKKQQVEYTLVQDAADWKISDMSYAEGSTLRTVLNAALPATTTT